MTKAKRAMKEDVKLVDLVIELVDARAPLASRNPDIDSLAAGKGRVILLNKADLASEKANAAWIAYFGLPGHEDRREGEGNLKAVECPDPGGMQGEDRARQKTRNLKPPGTRHGGGDPKCRKIHLYQQLCRKGGCEDRK